MPKNEVEIFINDKPPPRGGKHPYLFKAFIALFAY